MIAQETSEGIAGLVVSQCLTETEASEIQIPGVGSDSYGRAVKLAILEMLERAGKLHRGQRGGFKIGPGPNR